MKIGYARVSKGDGQNIKLQTIALRKAGCARISCDTASGATADRKWLKSVIARLAPGDDLIVWKLDRLSRSLHDLLELLKQIEAKGAHFVSITEGFDTGTASGRMMIHILGVVAEFEREQIRDRTRAGLAAAQLAGRNGGRPRALTAEQERAAIDMVEDHRPLQRKSVGQVAAIFEISKETLHRILARHRAARVSKGKDDDKKAVKKTRHKSTSAAGARAGRNSRR